MMLFCGSPRRAGRWSMVGFPVEHQNTIILSKRKRERIQVEGRDARLITERHFGETVLDPMLDHEVTKTKSLNIKNI